MIRIFLAFSIICLTLLGNAQSSKLAISSFELENGLKVLLNPDQNASNVYGAVWVNAGGKDDPTDATGIAHYLEHMLFKGTTELGTQDYEKEKIHLDSIKVLYDLLGETNDQKLEQELQQKINQQELAAAAYAIPNEFDKLLQSLGSTGVNASTGKDYTNYYNYFPANQLPKWLDLYAHRFQDPVFRLFQSELEAVYEEKNRAGDDLERRVSSKFNEYIYGDHPYSSQTVLGSVEHLKKPSLSKMYAYFQKYYVPNNMALVLAGNFNPEEVKPLIEKSFGQLKKGSAPVFPTYEPNAFDGRVLEKMRITPIKAGFMGYKLVPEGHPDRVALEVVGAMMSNSNQTGFIDQLSLEGEALYAGAYQEFMEDDGSTFIFYVPKLFGKSLKKFEKNIQSSFSKIAEGDFSDAYFKSIKNGIYKNFSLSLESLSSRGRYLGLSFIYDIDHNVLLSFPEKVRQLTKQDVQQVAKKYYGNDFFTLQSRTGFPKKVKLKKPAYKPIDSRTEASSSYAASFDQIEELTSAPDFIDLQDDLTIVDDYFYYTNNPLNEVFTLRLQLPLGDSIDPSYQTLVTALNNARTEKYSVPELKTAFANLGATYNVQLDYNSIDLTLTGLDTEFDETLALFEHLLTAFEADDQTIKYLFNQRTTNNKISLNNPATAARALYVYGLFGEKSAYYNRLPGKELKKLQPETLTNKLSSLVKGGFASIHYIGTLSSTNVSKTILDNSLFKKNTDTPLNFLEARTVDQTTFYIIDDKKAIQSYVYYVVNGTPLKHEDFYKKEAFNAYYTNSLSGLLFQEVREFRSLAYATGGNYVDPIFQPEKKGRLVLFTGSQADKTADAVNVVLGLINDMPVYESRLPTIKNGLLLKAGSNKPSFRSMSLAVDTFLKSGFSEDPNKTSYPKYQDLTFDDITSFYESTIKEKPAVVTIYGDVSSFDLEKIKKHGQVILLEMEDIMKE